jgi:hypothetical protein
MAILNMSNLRLVTKNYENGTNSLPHGLRVVHGKYSAQISVNGVNGCLGRFDKVDDAEKAYLEARIKRDRGYINDALEVIEKLERRLNELNSVELVQ